MSDYKHKDWQGATDGTRWMQNTLIFLCRMIPLPVIYALMGLVIPFYMLFGHQGYLASYRFYRIRLKRKPVKAFFCVYANEFRLGQVVVDRFAMYAGKKFSIKTDGIDLYDKKAAEGGVVLISSHVGNYEIAGYSLESDKKFHVLVYSGETESVMKGRKEMFGRNNISMVPVDEDLSHIFTLNNALSDGEIVSIHGDRIFGSGKSCSCEFFGSNAVFPTGPFILARLHDAPVFGVFAMKEGLKKYHVFIHLLEAQEPDGGNSACTPNDLVKAYASVLEKTVRKFPLQWYNFYDFWKP